MIPRLSTGRILAASAVAALGLLVVGWLDYTATRRELLQLLRDQAGSVRQTISAAARANEAAGAQAEAQVTERLLDNLRLLAELDRRGGLSQEFLDSVANRNLLFRVAVFAPDGTRELASRGGGRQGQGRGFPGASLLQRLLDGSDTELVEQMHSPWWGGGARIAAGIRRARGGAILLNADATDIEALQRQVSLDSLVRDIAANATQIAYVAVERGDVRVAHGDLPAAWPAQPEGDAVQPQTGVAEVAERELLVNGRPVLELAAPVTLGSNVGGHVRLGLRLDDLHRAERRVLFRLALSLASALILSLLVLGTVWLRQAYSTLSEKHALAEAALRRRDRLSAMGELASTVAHEVRNPLNAIAMSSQRLRREFLNATTAAGDQDRADLEQLLGVVEGETRRINDIVQQFLEFARPPALAPLPPTSPRLRPTPSRRCARWPRTVVSRSRRTRREPARPSSTRASSGRRSTIWYATRSKRRRRAVASASRRTARRKSIRSPSRMPAPALTPRCCPASSICTSRRRRRAPASGWPSRSRS